LTRKARRIRLTNDQLLLIFAGMMFGVVPLLIGIVFWRIRKERTRRYSNKIRT
jgi:hypothetical protein